MSAALKSRSMQIAEEAEAHFARAGAGLFIPSAGPLTAYGNAVSDSNDAVEYTSLEDAFPDVPPLVKPSGNLVLVQLRQPPLYTPGGIELERTTVQTEKDNTQVAKVIAIGPLAFHNRDTYQVWPEGAWCKVGDYVRVPKYQGDMWTVPYKRACRVHRMATDRIEEKVGTDYVRFALFKDLTITGVYEEADVLRIRCFL